MVFVPKEKHLSYDDMPFPAMDLLDSNKYFQPGKTFLDPNLNDGRNSSVIMVTRGCPYSCSFCAAPVTVGRNLRARSLENVEREVENLLVKYGVGSIRWQDDCIPLNFRIIPGLADYLATTGILSRGSARTDQISGGYEARQLYIQRKVYFRRNVGRQVLEKLVLELNLQKMKY